MTNGQSLRDWPFPLERVTGIEPALSAWEAEVLPLNYTRVRSSGEVLVKHTLHVPAGRKSGDAGPHMVVPAPAWWTRWEQGCRWGTGAGAAEAPRCNRPESLQMSGSLPGSR